MPIYLVRGRASYNVCTEVEAASVKEAGEKAQRLNLDIFDDSKSDWKMESPACPAILSSKDLWIVEKP